MEGATAQQPPSVSGADVGGSLRAGCLSPLIELSRSWRTASDLREFLGEMERRAAGINGLEELISWGRAVADKVDPLSGRASEVLAERSRTWIDEAAPPHGGRSLIIQ